jgi:DNA-binding response OmpR family regulator
VVDDEPDVRSLLRRGFETAGYGVLEAGNKSSLMQALADERIDLITLDLGLGEEDGLDLAREIRATRNVPIMMVTGRGAPEQRYAGLEHGADDYIVKPFHIGEILHRTRTVLSRYGLTDGVARGPGRVVDDGRYRFETGTLDVARRCLLDASGVAIDLTDAEVDLLAVFLRHPARILSRDDLMAMAFDRTWTPFDRTVDGHVARLRRKIEPDGDTPRLIRSVRSVGYVFTGDVERV